MGILNITTDSFYDGGKYIEDKNIYFRVDAMLKEGVSIIDVGAYSSRPGACDIPESVETDNLLRAIRIIKQIEKKCIISVDTFRSHVALKCIAAGAHIINDISGGNLDNKMFDVVRDLQIPYVLMHMRGTPQNMMQNTTYEQGIIEALLQYFQKKINILTQKNIKKIILDPGFGFAKTLDQNFCILNHLNELLCFNYPLLVGLSRKSMVYKLLDTTSQHALNGTTVLHTLALYKGANILRVHDVKEAKETITLFNKTVSV